MNTIKTDVENIFRDPNSKSLSIVNEDERNRIKQQRKLIDRVYKLEESVDELNKKIDTILTILRRRRNEPRTY